MGRIEDVILLFDEPATAETMLALEAVGAVLQELALNEAVTEADRVTFIESGGAHVHQLVLVEVHAIQTVFGVHTSANAVNAILDILRRKKAIDTPPASVEVIPRCVLRKVDQERAMPGTGPEHVQKFSTRFFIRVPRAKIELSCPPQVFFLRVLLITNTVLLVPKVTAENAAVAVAAIIEKSAVTALSAM